jgi:hypothetical protein
MLRCGKPGSAPRAAQVAVLCALAAILLVAPRALSDDHDLWFTVEVAGQKAGWQRLTRRTEGDEVTTSWELHMSFQRGSGVLELVFRSGFVETTAGTPVRMWFEQKIGGTPLRAEYTFTPEGIDGSRRVGEGEPERSRAPLPRGHWLTPCATSRHVAERLEAGDGRFLLARIEPSIGPRPIRVAHTLLERTTARVGPPDNLREVEVWRCGVERSVTGDRFRIEHIDERGVAVITEDKWGALPRRIVLSDEASATRPAPPPDLLAHTLIKLDEPIAFPRRTSSATYLVATVEGPLPDLPQDASQSFERLGAQSARIAVDTRKLQPAKGVDREEHLAPTMVVNTDDEVIQRLARQATEGAGESPQERAEAMRRFVHQYIATGLDTGFSSASEVARSREGDCTEFTVLLAALLRVEGIPSRGVRGLLYVDRFAGHEHIFGYHMWTQALLEVEGRERWVDLDATLSGPHFDAAHIALATTPLRDPNDKSEFIFEQVGGNLKVVVEHVR